MDMQRNAHICGPEQTARQDRWMGAGDALRAEGGNDHLIQFGERHAIYDVLKTVPVLLDGPLRVNDGKVVGFLQSGSELLNLINEGLGEIALGGFGLRRGGVAVWGPAIIDNGASKRRRHQGQEEDPDGMVGKAPT